MTMGRAWRGHHFGRRGRGKKAPNLERRRGEWVGWRGLASRLLVKAFSRSRGHLALWGKKRGGHFGAGGEFVPRAEDGGFCEDWSSLHGKGATGRRGGGGEREYDSEELGERESAA